MTIEQFSTMAIEEFENHPIDSLFLYIQNDKELMKEYLDLVAENGDLGKVNRMIARQFAVQHNTHSNGMRNENPNSTLIQSHALLED